MPSNHLILCCPLLLLPSIFPSIRVFSNESALRIRWPKYWSFTFNISPSNEYPGLISFRMDWLDLLAVQGTLKSLLQHCSSKASILRCSVFFIVQLSHPYMITGKTIALTRQTFVGKVMSLLFNIAFLNSEHLGRVRLCHTEVINESTVQWHLLHSFTHSCWSLSLYSLWKHYFILLPVKWKMSWGPELEFDCILHFTGTVGANEAFISCPGN